MSETLTYEELRQRAQEVVEASDKTQLEIAEELGLHETTISRALSESGGKYQTTQIRIIEHLTGIKVERQVWFVLREESSQRS